MFTPMRHTSGQEMIEALFAVLFASVVLSAAISVFSGGGGVRVEGGEVAHRLLRSLLNWEVWLEDGAINVDVARGITYQEMKRGVGAKEDFQVRIYCGGEEGLVLLYDGGRPGGEELTHLSSPTPLIVNGERLPGMLEVIV